MAKTSLNLHLYPIVVRQSRYSGVYEGGLWFAIANYDDDNLSAAYRSYIDGDDCDAVDFWQSDESKSLGVGENPDGAVLSLMKIHLEKNDEEKHTTIYVMNLMQRFHLENMNPSIINTTIWSLRRPNILIRNFNLNLNQETINASKTNDRVSHRRLVLGDRTAPS